MLKRLIFSVIFFFCIGADNFLYAALVPYKTSVVPFTKHTLVEPWKYGAVVATGLTSRRLTGFVEYKIKRLGLETGLGYFKDNYIAGGIPLNTSNKAGLLEYKTIIIPIILKLYSGNDRQFALRLGLQAGYVVSNKIATGASISSAPSPFDDELDYVDVSSLMSSSGKMANWYSAYIFGFDYESDFGFIWGFDTMDQLNSLIASKGKSLSYSYMINFGFNLGVFFY